MHCFRGGRSPSNKAKSFPWTQGSLPVSSCTGLHVKIWKPHLQRDEQGWELLSCTAVTPVVSLDPHNGSLLAEVCQNHVKYRYTDYHCEVEISKATVKAISKILHSNVQFHKKKSNNAPENVRTYFGEEDFSRTEKGTRNIIKFVSSASEITIGIAAASRKTAWYTSKLMLQYHGMSYSPECPATSNGM